MNHFQKTLIALKKRKIKTEQTSKQPISIEQLLTFTIHTQTIKIECFGNNQNKESKKSQNTKSNKKDTWTVSITIASSYYRSPPKSLKNPWNLCSYFSKKKSKKNLLLSICVLFFFMRIYQLPKTPSTERFFFFSFLCVFIFFNFYHFLSIC